MNHPEYIEYKGFEKEVRDTIESQYQMAMYQGDFMLAYNLIGKLMSYKMIDRDDARIENNNKTYAKGGVDKDHRFPFDYRKDYNYIPDWLFGTLYQTKLCSCESIEHIGKRVEGNYEGDTVFPSRNYNVRISLCKTTKAVENAFEGIRGIMVEEGNKNFSGELIENLCKEGVYRVFSLTIEGNCVNKFKTIGYALLKMGETDMECTMVIKYKSLIGTWLPIKSTIEQLSKGIKGMIGGSGKFKTAKPWDDAINSQQSLLSRSNAELASV